MAGRTALSPVSAVERFSADRTVPRLAREVTRQFLTDAAGPGVADEAALLVSELITNAVEASEPGDRITLSLRVISGLLLIRVVDSAPGFPKAQEPAALQENGYGLFIVEELARTYGHVPMGGGKKCTYCTLLLHEDNTGPHDC